MEILQNDFDVDFGKYEEACNEVLNEILSIIPIDCRFFRYSARIKDVKSIKEKISRKKYDINDLQDIAGIRFAFGDFSGVDEYFTLYDLENVLRYSYFNNKYDFKRYLLYFSRDKKNSGNDFTFDFFKCLKKYFGKRIIVEKDYISCPKESGYQSLHIVIRASNGYPVEIQIRNLCQHIWSFLQHEVVYKGSSNGYNIIFFQEVAYYIVEAGNQYSYHI